MTVRIRRELSPKKVNLSLRQRWDLDGPSRALETLCAVGFNAHGVVGMATRAKQSQSKTTHDSSRGAKVTVLVIHGPNLNLLGTREPEVYGRTTLAEIDRQIVELGRELGVEVESFPVQ